MTPVTAASVASSAVFPPNWAVFQTQIGRAIFSGRGLRFCGAVSELAAGFGLPRFWSGTNGQLIQLMS